MTMENILRVCFCNFSFQTQLRINGLIRKSFNCNFSFQTQLWTNGLKRQSFQGLSITLLSQLVLLKRRWKMFYECASVILVFNRNYG